MIVVLEPQIIGRRGGISLILLLGRVTSARRRKSPVPLVADDPRLLHVRLGEFDPHALVHQCMADVPDEVAVQRHHWCQHLPDTGCRDPWSRLGADAAKQGFSGKSCSSLSAAYCERSARQSRPRLDEDSRCSEHNWHDVLPR